MGENQGLKLLAIDDEEGIVHFIKKLYDRRGFVTFVATDGVTGVEIFKKERPLVTLIDVHMPDSPIDGIETLRQIKAVDKDAICIMVTFITENEPVRQSRELGAAAYLLKPFEIKDLDKVISEVANVKIGEDN